MKRSYLLSLIPALVLLSCNKQDVVQSAPDLSGMEESVPVVFLAEGLSVSADVVTKASVVNEDNLTAFYAAATTGSAGSETSAWTSFQFTGSKGGQYAGTGAGKWWPSTDPGYHFYASNLALTFAAAGTSVTASNDTDVVCAYLPGPTYKGVNALSFEHVFARIGDVTVSAASGYTVTAVSIRITPKTGGVYNLRTGNGVTDGSAGWSSLTTGSATVISNTTPGTKSNDLYLVPGTYALTATWTATKGDYTQTFTNKSVNVAITGGKVNAISTTLGGLAEEVKFTVSVSPWGAASVNAVFPTS